MPKAPYSLAWTHGGGTFTYQGFLILASSIRLLAARQAELRKTKNNLHLSEILPMKEAKLQHTMQLQDQEQINKSSASKQFLIYCSSIPLQQLITHNLIPSENKQF